jgi:hypothetical protein
VPGISNPQALNRYSYVLGNPLRYTDPSGHEICDEDGNCHDANKGWYLAPGAKKWNYSKLIRSGYSNWESQALSKLYGDGGREGRQTVDYIIDNNVTIDFRWHLYAGAIWDDDGNALYINRDPDTTRPDDPFMLNLIAHETTHLQQGPAWALTKAGELEAWKVGFTVQNHLSPLTEGTPEYKIVNELDIWDTGKFTELVYDYNRNVSGGWIYNILFTFLPDWLPSIQMSPGR